MPRSEVLPKARFTAYLNRAREFARQMDRAAADRAWNSVGLLGVHCVISSCDALTVRLAGQRWSGQDHSGVIGMVNSLQLAKSEVAVRQIAQVLDKTNRVEYEARQFTEREAAEVRKLAARVLTWVSSQLVE